MVARTIRKPFIGPKRKPQKEDGEIPPFDVKELDDRSALDIYDHEALLEAVLKVNSINYAGVLNLSWGSIKLQLQTLSVEDMRKKFHDLNVTLRQIGVDDEKSFIEERILIGERLLAKDYQPLLIQYARRGVPPTLRCRVYKKIFYIDMTPRDYEYFQALNDHFKKWECAFITATDTINDDKYFIFEDFIKQCKYIYLLDT